MSLKELQRRENYLPYIFATFILASMIFEIFNRDSWLAIVIASCFFALLYFYKGFLITIIMMLFFVVGIYNNINYYNYEPSDNAEIARIEKVNSYGGVGRIAGRKIFLDGRLENTKIGDRILLSGSFTEDNDISIGIIGNYKFDRVESIKEDITTKVYRLREKIFNSIKDKLGWRRSALITSISFGYTEFLDEEDKNDMKNLGLMHAVAVSGLHMALVYSLINKIFPSKIAPFIAFVYLIFTGAPLSAIRAYIMIVCMNLAVPLRRNYNPIAGISLAGIIILLIRPYSLFEIGFQLSFLATLGIIFFNKDINKSLYKLPKYLREGISVCIAAQIFVFPVSVLYFREFSISFLLGNIFMAPLISLVVIMGNLLALTIFTSGIFNYLCFITYYITLLIDKVIMILDDLTPELIYLSESIASIYLSMLICYYFYKKGYRKFIYMPMVVFLYVSIVEYSPLPKIQYYREGAIVVSYRGDRVLLKLKSDLDMKKLSKIIAPNAIYDDIKRISIRNDITIEKYKNNYMLNNRGKQYILAVSKVKTEEEYDIINFKNNNVNEIILLSDKVIPLD